MAGNRLGQGAHRRLAHTRRAMPWDLGWPAECSRSGAVHSAYFQRCVLCFRTFAELLSFLLMRSATVPMRPSRPARSVAPYARLVALRSGAPEASIRVVIGDPAIGLVLHPPDRSQPIHLRNPEPQSAQF